MKVRQKNVTVYNECEIKWSLNMSKQNWMTSKMLIRENFLLLKIKGNIPRKKTWCFNPINIQNYDGKNKPAISWCYPVERKIWNFSSSQWYAYFKAVFIKEKKNRQRTANISLMCSPQTTSIIQFLEINWDKRLFK